MTETILEFLHDYAVELGAGAALLAIVVFIKNDFFGLFKKQKPTVIAKESVEDIAKAAQPSHETLSVVEFIRIRKELKADIEAELKDAAEEEKSFLRSKIVELERQIASPDEALLEAQKRITDLEALLDREGNDIGAERIEAAKNAMEAGDYSQADGIFAEIEAREELAVQRSARAAYGRGEVAEAEIRWQDAATHYARAAQLDPRFDTLKKARELAWRAGDYEAALRHGEDMLKLADQGALTAEQKAGAYNAHALTLKAQGQYAEAEKLYREALEIDAKTIGTAHPNYAAHLNNLAAVLEAQGQYAEAEKLYREALAIDAKTIGTAHPYYAIDLNNLAAVLKAQGQYAEAKKLHREAHNITAKTIGTAHPDYAIDLNNLAGVLEAQGQYAEAEKLYREALEIAAKTTGTAHPNYATSLNNLAAVLEAQGQYEEAENLYREALAIDAKTIGTAHPDYASDLNNLAGVLVAQGQYAEAETHCRKAIDIWEARLGAEHPKTLLGRENLEILLANSKP